MTQQHPFTLPPELVEQFAAKSECLDTLCNRAAQCGADQELEACLGWLVLNGYRELFDKLRAARRPKLPSLKEQALEAMREMQIEPCIINGVDTNAAVRAKYETIRRALESIPDPS